MMEISKELKDEIWDYCRVNNITNIDAFTMKILKQGFTVEKFGATPQTIEKIVEVEKVVEKIVEKIVEVKVEVPTEKEVYITDDKQVKKLSEKITKLEGERDSYKKDAENFHKEWNDTLQKLEVEQKKNKRDLYGE
jgi:hypothetical protein